MPLLMLDLDNTLIERDAAFREAVAVFLSEHGLPVTDLDWLMAIDLSGYAARSAVAEAIAARYGAAVPTTAIRGLLDHGAADRVVLHHATRGALEGAVAAGWTCVIVTNGRVEQQYAKIRKAGLDQLVHGWAISEQIGHRKPEPEIFQAAAHAVNASLREAWMIGDSAHADIAGAFRLGIPSVWLSAGRPWSEASYHPAHIAQDVATAIRHVISTDRRAWKTPMPDDDNEIRLRGGH